MTHDGTAGGSGERAVPFYCPYCGDEDLVPDGPEGGTWACRACARHFALSFRGVGPPAAQ